ncbi:MULTISPECIES: beta-N-acetylhexosaminidase [Streptomyces]|uniref:Beta-N-acetylglucosaminidase n=1 Tax=Streptomyces dengpaensis TaxID=2049881 RepID=A0ABN5I0J8_9ACTN|nr:MULTISPECIES: glycoside hydrolase family 20 protein [Streptomyces]AVH56916.1 beta-N-acetylglucosaminidase [Streptomyces dengpaensis]
MRKANRRRRVPARRKRGALAAGAAVAVTGIATAVAVAVWPSGGGDSTGASVPGHKAAVTDPPSPTRTYSLSRTPRTIPAVREHTPARGPGWRPVTGARVVVSDADLADEGRLLAGELNLTYAGQTGARDGDVALGLDEGSGGAESYTLTVRNGRVTITGPSDAGVFYGTRTLKQEVHGGGTAPEGVVRDRPAKAQRGLMLDIARKHFTADWIEDRVRELGDLKFNQLGLHFSDDQGFRIQSDTHPEIVSKQHLSKAEVRRIIDLAKSRHITVVPEIDSPGHLGAVIAAHPDLQLRNVSGVATRGAVDISKPAAADLIDELLNEYAGLFPGAFWHLGGDEYQALTVANPEASYPQLATAAQAAYGSGATVADLATGWLNDRAAVVRGHDRTPRAWNDGFFRGGEVQADADLQVAYWTGKEIGARQPVEYLSAGRELINYNDEFLYYVLGQPQTFVYPTGQRIYEQWTPLVVRGTTAVPTQYDAQILGGVFAVWADLSGAQTQDQVAAGIRMPLRATVQKLWNPERPGLSWVEFKTLADRLG